MAVEAEAAIAEALGRPGTVGPVPCVPPYWLRRTTQEWQFGPAAFWTIWALTFLICTFRAASTRPEELGLTSLLTLVATVGALFTWRRRPRYGSLVERVRASVRGLELLIHGAWQPHAWHDVELVEPVPRELTWRVGADVVQVRVAGAALFLRRLGDGAAIVRAASLAAADRPAMPTTVGGLTAASLSPAEHLAGEEDRGLSQADA